MELFYIIYSWVEFNRNHYYNYICYSDLGEKSQFGGFVLISQDDGSSDISALLLNNKHIWSQ